MPRDPGAAVLGSRIANTGLQSGSRLHLLGSTMVHIG